MWPQRTEPPARMPKSDLACHSCRKRKVKCDREFPQCLVCGQTGQPCNYPLRPMKPGPKIGTLQRQKRSRQRKTKRTDQPQHDGSLSSSPIDHSLHPYDGEFETPQEVSENDIPSLATDNTDLTSGAKIQEDERKQDSHLNMHDLSFILHPCHEPSTPENDQNQSPGSKEGGQPGLCRQACNELGVSLSLMNQMIRVYFDNMVAINLFHEPSFPEKLMEIPSLCQISALLAAMAAYASRFLPFETDPLTGGGLALTEKCHHNPAHFVDIAFNEINKALAECDDELPPLCVIQALIIATHCQLTRGVHGKAWRSLGLCVRLAYETNLHLLDSRTAGKTEEPAQWKADEEKRRAFWAIWEMDVFASTIRRTPTAVDWTQMEILLPVDNANWFQSRPASSCFMEAEPNKRWKALQDSGNQSPKAWFLVINSLMKAAQAISNPRGVAPMGHAVNYQPTHRTSTPESVEEARKGLETLANAVRCFGLALPRHLQYRDQYLAFSAIGQHQFDSERQQHCSIYNIFVMTHLTRLMIHRYDAFRPQTRHSEAKSRHHPSDSANGNEFGVFDAETVALRHYFDATDSILRIVNQSCEEHIRYINPFLSSTIWLASAVQLVRKHLSRTPSNRSLIKSRFDVLYLTYKRCIQFWDTQTALQQNLESLEVQLEAQQAESNKREARASKKTSKRTSEEAEIANQSSSDQQWGQAEHDAKRQRIYLHNSSHSSKKNNGLSLSNSAKIQDNYSTQFLPGTPSTPPVQMLSLDQGELERMTNQAYADEHPDPTQKMAMLDFMPLPEVNPHPISEPYIMPTNPVFFKPMNMLDTQQDRSMEWPNIEFASGIHDLLAGWSMY